jgi:hypothetical protein
VVQIAADHPFEYTWPPTAPFAADWCEVFQSSDGSVAIVLFENRHVARVVCFQNGQFHFRQKLDELISAAPLIYCDLDHDGTPEFVGREKSAPNTVTVSHWDSADGFVDVTLRYRAKIRD